MRLDDARMLKSQLLVPSSALEASTSSPVAVGIAPRGQGEYRIAVRAREKTAKAMKEIERIRAAAGGEIDLRFTGRIIAATGGAGLAAAANALRIGASVGHVSSTAGTLGCFARGADGATGFISNNHVIALEDSGHHGDEILHPAPLDKGKSPDDVVATLRSPYPLLSGGTRTVDCAFGLLATGVNFDASSLGGGKVLKSTVAPVEDKAAVTKIGRTTGSTAGRVLAFEVNNVVVDYPFSGMSVRFDDQIELEPDSGVFADRGDSGSLVFDEDQQAVGLLFAIIADRQLAYANPMQTVLNALTARLVT